MTTVHVAVTKQLRRLEVGRVTGGVCGAGSGGGGGGDGDGGVTGVALLAVPAAVAPGFQHWGVVKHSLSPACLPAAAVQVEEQLLQEMLKRAEQEEQREGKQQPEQKQQAAGSPQ